MHRAPSMASNVEQRLLALEQVMLRAFLFSIGFILFGQGLLRVAALEQSHAQIAQLHDMVSADSLFACFHMS